MRRVQGNNGVRLLECTNPKKDKWRIRWDVRTEDDGTTSYMEQEFGHKPTDGEIRDTVTAWCNEQTDTAILSGFSYGDALVWLSTENQFNYKAAYDLAVQTEGATLPVTFKFGTDEEPVYRTFDTLDGLADFYKAAMAHIQAAVADGWKKKDSFKLEDYHMDG